MSRELPNLEYKLLKKKKLDKELTLKVIKHEASERIFVEFSSKDGKMVLHKSFQDTYLGREEASAFEESIKSIDELKNRLYRSKHVIK